MINADLEEPGRESSPVGFIDEMCRRDEMMGLFSAVKGRLR